MREANQLFASLREHTLETRAIVEFSFLSENLQLCATKVRWLGLFILAKQANGGMVVYVARPTACLLSCPAAIC